MPHHAVRPPVLFLCLFISTFIEDIVPSQAKIPETKPIFAWALSPYLVLPQEHRTVLVRQHNEVHELPSPRARGEPSTKRAEEVERVLRRNYVLRNHLHHKWCRIPADPEDISSPLTASPSFLYSASDYLQPPHPETRIPFDGG